MLKNYSIISLIMPCKNEATALKTVLEKLPREIDEVIVVDNNSSDKTKRVARRFGARIFSEPRTDKNSIGYGFAIQKGIKEAKGNIIVCMDGDGSYPVREIAKIVNCLLKKDLDFISCNRLPFKKPKKMSFIRASGVKILNIFTLFLYGHRIKDSLSGMWVFRRYALDNLILTEGGWNLSLEIKLKVILQSKLKFAERQISYHDRIFDISKQNLFRTGIEHVLYLIRFRLSIAWGKIFAQRITYNVDK
ncbi:glycosyltransferase family 2 protein [Candidatus Roizmanbacteria bacterium]|nr:glycosyltransferase family 2 protein [Candidatus Roizmanbacteria bacterium]